MCARVAAAGAGAARACDGRRQAATRSALRRQSHTALVCTWRLGRTRRRRERSARRRHQSRLQRVRLRATGALDRAAALESAWALALGRRMHVHAARRAALTMCCHHTHVCSHVHPRLARSARAPRAGTAAAHRCTCTRINSYNTRWAACVVESVFPTAAPPSTAADLVTIFFGANDAVLPGLPGDASRQHVPVAEYEERLSAFVQRAQKANRCGEGDPARGCWSCTRSCVCSARIRVLSVHCADADADACDLACGLCNRGAPGREQQSLSFRLHRSMNPHVSFTKRSSTQTHAPA